MDEAFFSTSVVIAVVVNRCRIRCFPLYGIPYSIEIFLNSPPLVFRSTYRHGEYPIPASCISLFCCSLFYICTTLMEVPWGSSDEEGDGRTDKRNRKTRKLPTRRRKVGKIISVVTTKVSLCLKLKRINLRGCVVL